MSNTQSWVAKREAARQATMAYFKTGKSRWIDVSIDEGWSSILRDWVLSSIYHHARVDGALPTLAHVDRLFTNIRENDHEAAIRSRVALNADIERQILEARGRKEKLPYVSTEELAKQFKVRVAEGLLPAVDIGPIPRVDRPSFEAIQANSPNHHLHGGSGLTDQSRRMTGEHAE